MADAPKSEEKENTSRDISDMPSVPVEKTEILIAYFSCTNTTKKIAESIADETDGALYEIVPEQPYTEDDLKYYTNCRADREQNDPNVRPAIAESVKDMEKYTVIFIGYPIWHGQAPRIISTFLENYDFCGKTMIPFCTSHSSGIGSSDINLHSLTANADWKVGMRFGASATKDEISEWIEGLNIKMNKNNSVAQFDLVTGENSKVPAVKMNSGYEMPINVWKENVFSNDEKAKHASEMVFPIGETNDSFTTYFIGQSYLATISTSPVGIFNVTFEPGCRNNWHIHKAEKGGGQILICLAGRGYYQEYGKPGTGTSSRECR